jgi:hypothetical protein
LRPLQGSTQHGPPSVRLLSLTPHTRWPEDQLAEEPRPRGRGWQLSWSSAPLRRFSSSESTPPRFANTGYVPSSGFFTLSTVSSSLERPVLFRTGYVLGVSPSRGFPSLPGLERSSRREYPLDVLPPHGPLATIMLANSLCRRRVTARSGTAYRRHCSPSGSFSSNESVPAAPVLPVVRTVEPLLGFCSPLQGSVRHAGHVARAVFRPCASPSCLPPGVRPKSQEPSDSHPECAPTVFPASTAAWPLGCRKPLLRFLGLSRPNQFEAVRKPVSRWPTGALRRRAHVSMLPTVSWAYASSTGVW